MKNMIKTKLSKALAAALLFPLAATALNAADVKTATDKHNIGINHNINRECGSHDITIASHLGAKGWRSTFWFGS